VLEGLGFLFQNSGIPHAFKGSWRLGAKPSQIAAIEEMEESAEASENDDESWV
jgi:hypothetical protein